MGKGQKAILIPGGFFYLLAGNATMRSISVFFQIAVNPVGKSTSCNLRA
jgi:hypothetical protein